MTNKYVWGNTLETSANTAGAMSTAESHISVHISSDEHVIICSTVALGHGRHSALIEKIREEKICFQHKLKWLELHLYYLK